MQLTAGLATKSKHSRKLNVMINGVSSLQEESLAEVVFVVANKFEVPLKQYHVCVIHRLPGKK